MHGSSAPSNAVANGPQNAENGSRRLDCFLAAAWRVDHAKPTHLLNSLWDGSRNDSEGPGMKPEQQARQRIDAQLLASGWIVQDYTKMDITSFTPDQLAWLNLIRDHIATSVSIDRPRET
jgi:hypothetical protein